MALRSFEQVLGASSGTVAAEHLVRYEELNSKTNLAQLKLAMRDQGRTDLATHINRSTKARHFIAHPRPDRDEDVKRFVVGWLPDKQGPAADPLFVDDPWHDKYHKHPRPVIPGGEAWEPSAEPQLAGSAQEAPQKASSRSGITETMDILTFNLNEQLDSVFSATWPSGPCPWTWQPKAAFSGTCRTSSRSTPQEADEITTANHTFVPTAEAPAEKDHTTSDTAAATTELGLVLNEANGSADLAGGWRAYFSAGAAWDLRAACVAWDLPHLGNKRTLVKRLVDHMINHPDQQPWR